MSILKYKDPKTGEFKRINPYGNIGKAVEITEISGETALSDDIITELQNDLNWISYGGGAYRFVSVEEDKRLYSYTTEDKISQILVNTLTKTCALRETQITAASVADSIVKRDSYGEIPVPTPSRDSSATNKAYVDDADKLLRLKLSNLEQALNGYILDTTEETYANLDRAVLKDSVTVGDNIYPIADKTRALVSRIEGKTTKMVQLLDKSKYYGTKTKLGITATNNGDGSWTINGTATEGSFLNFSEELSLDGGHKVLLTGNKTNSGFALGLLNQNIRDFGNGGVGNIKADSGKSWGIVWENGAVINNVTIYPQLFDLTAMNREDITTAEQFKAEFPELYPYENGNIYPAKISGVEFTGRNLKNIPNGIGSKDYAANELPKNIPLVLSARLSLKEGNARVRASWIKNGTREYAYGNTITASTGISKVVFTIPSSATDTRIALQTFGDDVGFEYSNVQIEAGTAATAYEPYIEPVSVTLPETYELHGIGNYKDYLEITKNENNELYTLKKVQSVEVDESEKIITPLATPVETVIATNLTYEQVTAIRHNGGLIEVEGNTNKGYARPTVKNTIVYRLTATNTAEG